MENTTNKEAYYKVMKDVYHTKHRFRSSVFSRILKHMLSKIGTECTIYCLIEEIKKNK